MTDSEKERLLADCLDDFHRRRALREPVEPERYRERLGSWFQDFLDVLAAESAIDAAVEPSPVQPLPRPFGEYTLVGELGRGAMGVVYEAVHRSLGRRVALKILRTGFDTEPQARARFRQEAQACAQVRHDHIVEIYEAGEVDGHPFYAMPMLAGRTLTDLIRSDEPIPPKDLCRGLAGIADALATLHHAGIVHRDVKPSNIMVDPRGHMVLADFGLARSAASQTLTQTGQALGTPLYMSPEQLLGRKDLIDGRTDVYGLGVSMYEALAGRPPFQADDFPALMRMIVTERPAPLHESRSGVPRECAYIVMKAMEQRREDRYASAAELREDLQAFSEDRPVSGRPVSPLRRMWRRFHGPLLLAATILVVATAVLLLKGADPATLDVKMRPPAELFVDGRSYGTTPVRVEVESGERSIELVHPALGRFSETVVLEPGQVHSIDKDYQIRDPEVTAQMNAVGEFHGLALRKFTDRGRHRGGGTTTRGAPFAEPVFPRGEVRLEDLTTYRIDLIEELDEPDGHLRFVRGEEVLHEEPYDPELTVTIADLPRAVREALRPGDEVTWGYYPRAKEKLPEVVRFRLVPRGATQETAHALTEIEEKLAAQPELARRHFRAQALLDRGLAMAVIAEVRAILAERADSVRAWAVYREALRMVKATETKVGFAVQEALDELDAEALREVIVEEPEPR